MVVVDAIVVVTVDLVMGFDMVCGFEVDGNVPKCVIWHKDSIKNTISSNIILHCTNL